jgi:chromosome segregation ATPase
MQRSLSTSHILLTIATISMFFALGSSLSRAADTTQIDTQETIHHETKGALGKQAPTKTAHTDPNDRIIAPKGVISSTTASTTKNNTDGGDYQMKNNLAVVEARLTAVTERLDRVVVRIESRMKKISDAGTDTSKEMALVDEAKGILSKARTDIANATPLTANQKGQFAKAKVQLTNIQDSLKKAQKDLIDAVSMLGQENHSIRATGTTTRSTH